MTAGLPVSVDFLARFLNLAAIFYVAAISTMLLKSHPKPYFRHWVHGYAVSFLLVALPLVAPVETTAWCLPEFLVILLAAWYFFLTGYCFQEGRWLSKRKMLVFLGVVALSCVGVFFLGLPPKQLVALPFLVLSLVEVRLGLILFQSVKTSRAFSVTWLALPFIGIGLLPLGYAFMSPSHQWIGYALAAMLHTAVGTGMVVHILLENDAENETLMREKISLQEDQIGILTQAERMKEEFISVISHELRTPLNLIEGFGSLLSDEVAGPLNPQQHDYLEKLRQGSERMLQIVDNLIDYAQMKAQKLEIMPIETPYRALIDEMVVFFRSLARSKGISIHVESSFEQPVLVDPQRIGQVLRHLMANAIKFTPAGGSILVRVRAEGGCMITEVTDSGIGIPPEAIASIFTPFHQLDMSHTRQAGGTGLGLSICKALIEAHGGTIGARSDGMNTGTTIWFQLPLEVPAKKLLEV